MLPLVRRPPPCSSPATRASTFLIGDSTGVSGTTRVIFDELHSRLTAIQPARREDFPSLYRRHLQLRLPQRVVSLGQYPIGHRGHKPGACRQTATAALKINRRACGYGVGGLAADGLPVGLQVIGRHLEDRMLLRGSVVSEAAAPWREKWPPLVASASA